MPGGSDGSELQVLWGIVIITESQSDSCDKLSKDTQRLEVLDIGFEPYDGSRAQTASAIT